MIEEIYAERILQHYRSPKNYGRMKKYDFKAKEINVPCGDVVEIFVKVKKDRIEDIKFVGQGCAISQAATSILTEAFKGKKVKEVEKISGEQFIKNFLGIDITYRRFGCATVGLRALKKALQKES